MASDMNARQTRAGTVPPSKLLPRDSSAPVLRSSLYMPTADESCGVKPTNQASLLSLFVPVLPATGRSARAAAVPVPPLTTDCSATMASAATSSEMTCLGVLSSGMTSTFC